ncbi:hypothetical protein OG21DRAFT_1507027, partial [Imleria badia]
MRFSVFAVISGLAVLAVVNALPALRRGVPFGDVSRPTKVRCMLDPEGYCM